MDPVTLALTAAKFVPDIIGWVKGSGSKEQQVAEKILGIADTIAGKGSPEASMEAINADPEFQLQFQKAVMADKHVFDQMCLENTKDARSMYKEQNKAADDIAEAIIKYNLIIVFLLVGFQVVAGIWLSDSAALLATVSNIIGIVIHALLKERQDVINFFFGSSLGSKQKAKQLGSGKQ